MNTTPTFAIRCLGFLFCLLQGIAYAQTSYATPFYVVAHMVNTPDAVRWALQQGANGIEMDIHFNATGQPQRFYHGGKCDCYCAGDILGDTNVCSELKWQRTGGKRKLINPCEAQSSFSDMLDFVVQQKDVALWVLDSKPTSGADAAMQATMGRNLVNAIHNRLASAAAKNFTSQIVISVATMDNSAYIEAVAKTVRDLGLQERVWITFDQEGDKAEVVLARLAAFGVTRPAWAAGASACYPTQFLETTKRISQLPNPPFVYTWTLDSARSMRRYIAAGAQGILTNHPARLRALLTP